MRMLAGVVALAFSGGLFAQSEGLAPEWEVSKSMEDFAAQVRRIGSILSKATPNEWVAKGASEAYVQQFKASQDELKYLTWSLEQLAKRPDKLTVALEAYFRADSVHTILGSMVDAIRRYQNPALADLLLSVLNETSPHTGKLRQYLVDLADVREKEFKVVDSEAQRCRSMLTIQPRASKPERQDGTKAVKK